jgi:hypothetical protein
MRFRIVGEKRVEKVRSTRVAAVVGVQALACGRQRLATRVTVGGGERREAEGIIRCRSAAPEVPAAIESCLAGSTREV